MRAVLFLLFILAPAVQAQCLPPDQIRQILTNLESYMVKIDVDGSGEDGSGFLLRSNLGVEMVTAHHVVVAGDGAEATCESNDTKPSDPKNLKPVTALFHKSQPHRRIRTLFSTTGPHFSYEHDLVKAPLPGTGFQGLEPEDSNRQPFANEGIVIAGYPTAKGRRFMRHHCRYKQMGEGLYTTGKTAYELHCPRLNYDIAAMSGGIAISTCTGKVVGAVSHQEYDADCSKAGNPRSVTIAPLSRNQAGQIVLGPTGAGETKVGPGGGTQFILGEGIR